MNPTQLKARTFACSLVLLLSVQNEIAHGVSIHQEYYPGYGNYLPEYSGTIMLDTASQTLSSAQIVFRFTDDIEDETEYTLTNSEFGPLKILSSSEERIFYTQERQDYWLNEYEQIGIYINGSYRESTSSPYREEYHGSGPVSGWYIVREDVCTAYDSSGNCTFTEVYETTVTNYANGYGEGVNVDWNTRSIDLTRDDLIALSYTGELSYSLLLEVGDINSLNAIYLTAEVGPIPEPVPLPPAIWLFNFGLLGLISIVRRKKVVSRGLVKASL